ncbi:Flp family type IVb pilin [Paraburkholderia sp. RL17-337-BIB-A]|uniref:Flp family type IVb pilin n=1 Tax=Paraburkholderia sp. RL17-337-BIB-A TaxID=3031636 RepID=UPI0038B6D2A7
MKKFTLRFLRDNKGVTAIEYGLIAGLLAVVIATSVTGVGKQISAVFDAVTGTLTTTSIPKAS